jgi:hypothetical protein
LNGSALSNWLSSNNCWGHLRNDRLSQRSDGGSSNLRHQGRLRCSKITSDW